MPPAPCPDPRLLRRLLEGSLPPGDAQSLLHHVEGCADCATRLRHLPDQDRLPAGLRAGRQAPQAPLPRPKAPRPESPSPATDTSVSGPDKSPTAAGVERGAVPPPPGPTGKPERVGPYLVLEELGAGGMGVVYLAEDPELKRWVVLKVMRPELAGNAAARERFRREAQAMAAVEHDHIVTVYQVGEHGGVPFLAMPFLKGETLESRLQREPRLPVAEVVRVGREVAEGLAAAHEHGLIHRDVKPGNLWLEGDRGRVKLLDFGLARVLEGSAGLTHTGTVLGTPAYMAPEQATGKPADARSDLFSLGCVLYRLATGNLPFQGDSPLVVLYQVANVDPPPPHTRCLEVPVPLSEFIMRLLSKEGEKRPASARRSSGP